MTDQQILISLPNPEATADLAQRIAPLLSPGDCLLLEGQIGAGKTHFARSLIQALLITPEDVPSPTFTLVQTYEVPDAEIWHFDLYRLTNTDDLFELGLEQALEQSICLIEWPDRLGALAPADALTLRFALDDQEQTRRLCVFGPWARWQNVLEVVDA